MSEDDNTTADDPQFSVSEALVAFIGVLAAMAVVFLLYIGLSDVPFGTQIATAFTYTGVVYWVVFYRTRAFNTGYSTDDEAVREKVPRLLGIHAGFLLLVLSTQTATLTVRPHLPAYWFAEHGPKHSSLYEDILILIPILIGTAQIVISRGILSRSVQAYKKRSAANANFAQDGTI